MNRGRLLRGRGKFDRAVSDLTEAIVLSPNYHLAYFYRGGIWEAKREYERAIADYDSAIQLESKNASYLNNRCWVRAVTGWEPEQALSDCGEALRINPEYAFAPHVKVQK